MSVETSSVYGNVVAGAGVKEYVRMKFQNRFHAGELLADELKNYAHSKEVIILALPRGGVVVASPIAKQLHVTMDLLIVKKLGVPHHEELAMGAVAMDATPIFNEDVITQACVSSDVLSIEIARKQKEIIEKNKLFRGGKSAPTVKNKIVIIVDDGIATGATVRAAIFAIQSQHPKKIILAVPVADKHIFDALALMVDEVVCLYHPEYLLSVGQWYVDFSQTTDEEVVALMRKQTSSLRSTN